MLMSADGDGIYQRDEKGAENAEPESDANRKQDSADETEQSAEQSPPIEVRVEVESAHRAAK